MQTDKAARIRALNDRLRQTFAGGRILITPGVRALPPDSLGKVVDTIRAFIGFSPENDPYDEHDFGPVEVDGERVFWKIDYYNEDLTGGADDPSDPAICTRIMTIMLASEY